MTKVYYAAPKAAKRTTFDTILPTGIILTPKEVRELCEAEEAYDFHMLPPYGAKHPLSVNNTNNVGVHYFCLQNNLHLDVLAANKNISVDVAFSILCHKVSEEEPTPSSRYVLYSLLRNPIVYKNADLFEIIFENALSGNGKDLLISLRGFALYFPIESLILVFRAIDKFSSTALTNTYLNVANDRKDEIIAWTSKTYPEMDGLPFSWILKAYGFADGILK